MEEMKEDICRLCLKFGGDTFSDFSDLSSKEKLKAVLPELNIHNPRDFVICSKCKSSLMESYHFVYIFSKNDDFIRKEKIRHRIVNLNLNRIIKVPKGKIDLNRSICRICLQTGSVSYRSLSIALTDRSFKDMMVTCLYKLDQNLTVNPLICESCQETLGQMFVFKKVCIDVEKKLVQYFKTSSEEQINLKKVLDSLNQSNSEKTDTNKKRPLPDAESDIAPPKKQKPSSAETKDENNTTELKPNRFKDLPLPHFNFSGYMLIYDSKYVKELEGWLSTVDQLKKENNWTDLMTMNKVLEKFELLSEIHPWLSKMTKVFTWEEWKKKLVDVFPVENDYGILLKKMIHRKKRANETFVTYYYEKMEILTAMNITGEKAISCLLGGLFDPVIRCVGRIGNYKEPEDLLLYFKTCDEKVLRNNKQVVQKPVQPKGPVKDPNLFRCHSCRKMVHMGHNCLGIVASKAQEEIAVKTASPKVSEKPVSNSASSQKKTEKSLSTTTQDKNISNIKPKDKVTVTNSKSNTSSSSSLPGKETSTATLPKQSKDVDKASKQDRSNEKDARGATTEKKNKQNDDDACFVKPLPPSRKSTPLSAVSQSKGSSSSGPPAQRAAASGSTSTTRQSESSSKKDTHSAAQKPESKESSAQKAAASGSTSTTKQSESSNKKDTHSAAQKPQSREIKPISFKIKTQTKERKDLSITKPRARNEKNNKGTSVTAPKEQKKENNSKVSSSRPEDRSGDKRTIAASKTQGKGIELVTFVKPQPSTGGSNSNRGTTGQKNEVDRRSTSAERRARAHSSRGTSATSSQDRKRESYSGRGASGTRSQRDREEDYAIRGISASASTRPDRRDAGYFDRGARSPEHIQETYLDRGVYGNSAQLLNEEINRSPSEISRARSSTWMYEDVVDNYINRSAYDIRREEEIEGNYPRRDLLDKRYEYTDPSVRPQDLWDIDYSSGDISDFRPEEHNMASYPRRELSSEIFQEPMERGASSHRPMEEERDIGYNSRGTSIRSEEQIVGSYPRRNLLSETLEEYMQRDASNVRSQEERGISYSNRDIPSRHEEHGMGSYSRRDLLGERFEEPDERGPFSVRPQDERDIVYSSRDISIRHEEHCMENYPRRDLLSERFEAPEERGASGVRLQDERDIIYSSRDMSIRHEEHGMENYPRRDLLGERFEDREERGASSVRPQDERDIVYNSRDMSVRREEHGMESYPRRDLLGERFEDRADRGASSAGYSGRDTSDRLEEQSLGSYPRKDLLSDRFQDRVERGASSARFQDPSVRPDEERERSRTERFGREIEGGNINSDRWREQDEMYNRGISKTKSPMLNEGSNVDRNLIGTRPEVEWESSYVDKGVTGVKGVEREDNIIDKGAIISRWPEDKKMEGSGFRADELMESTYLKKDAPSARPTDGSYPNRVAATTSPGKFKDGSHLNRSTLPSEKMPGRKDETYFQKSISSTRLLGSSLGSLFSLSLASRPLTSYPSCVTTPKPLGLYESSYVNRGLSRNTLRDYNKNRGVSEGMYSKRGSYQDARGQGLTKDNSRLKGLGLSTGKHQEHSHREMCMKCYTIGHNSVDCPRFRI